MTSRLPRLPPRDFATAVLAGRYALVVAITAAATVGAAVAGGHTEEVAMLLVAAFFGLLFVTSPVVALLAYVALRPVVDGVVLLQAGPVTVGQLWGAGLIVLLAAFLFAVGPGLRRPWPFAVVLLISLYALLSVRGDTSLAMQFGLKLAVWVLLIVAVERVAQSWSGQIACFRAGYGLAVATSAVIGVLILFGRYGSPDYSTLDLGIAQDPQPLAYLAVFALVFPLIALLQGWHPRISLGVTAALSAEIVISYVRTGLFAVVVMALVFLFVSLRRRRPVAFLIAGALGLTAYLVHAQLAQRLSDLKLLTSGDAAGAGSFRVAIWSSVWDSATSSVERVLIGSGAGTSNAAAEQAIGVSVFAHNDFLEFLATGGVVLASAYVLFVLWIISSVHAVYRSPAQSSRAHVVAALAFGAVGALLTMSILSSIFLYPSAVAFALLLGLLRGMANTPGATCFDREPVLAPAIAKA